jgi:hypothetical protein
LHQLQKLDLSYCCEITDSALLHLSTLPRLQELNIGGGNITDTGAAHLSHFLHLKLLDLSCSWEITDAGLDHLSGLPELETLILDECGQFTNEGLISLAMLPKEPLNKSLDKLRTNGNVLIPFVVSLSKHERN